MSPSARPRRNAAASASWPAAFALAGLAVLALPACDSPTVPAADEVAPDLPRAEAAVLPALVPVPPASVGCQPAVTYQTGDPLHPAALYQICWPETWNGQFIVYGHGYTVAGLPLSIPAEASTLAPFVTSQGFAFASTSYRVNGLAIKEGTQDIADLATKARQEALSLFGAASVPVLVAGASEGGAVSTLAAERYGGVFQGALSTCGPTGNFQKQLDYFGDFNVLFNYFFPAVFKDPYADRFKVTPEGVDADVMAGWASYVGLVTAAVAAAPGNAAKLVKVAGAAVDANDPGSVLNTILGILWYNVFATNDAIAKLDGQPFDNTRRWYWGSGNDFRLNRLVQRIHADPAARAAVAADYQTTGDLEMPYVSLHTTGDEIVQYIQQPWYRLKALFSGASREHSALPVFRYGHCNFEQGDLTVGLALLMLKVRAASYASLASAMPTPSARESFQRLAKDLHARR